MWAPPVITANITVKINSLLCCHVSPDKWVPYVINTFKISKTVIKVIVLGDEL